MSEYSEPKIAISVTSMPSADWPDLDWRAVCELEQVGVPEVDLCVRAGSEEEAGELCVQMLLDWDAGRRYRRSSATAIFNEDTCPHEIGTFDPGEDLGGGAIMTTGDLCASVEFPLDDEQAVGMMWFELPAGEAEDMEQAVRNGLVLHYNHWARGQERYGCKRQTSASSDSLSTSARFRHWELVAINTAMDTQCPWRY